MLSYILQGISLGFSASVSPGPLLTYIFNQTLKNGWKKTIPAAFAPLISDGPIIFLVLAILTNTPERFLHFLKIAGGVFILYLAKGAFYIYQDREVHPTKQPSPGNQTLIEATVMNFLNPNPYIFWGTILGPILISAWKVSTNSGMAFILFFYISIISTFIGFIFLFSFARRLGPKVTPWLNGLSAVILLGFGLYQIWSGIHLVWS